MIQWNDSGTNDKEIGGVGHAFNVVIKLTKITVNKEYYFTWTIFIMTPILPTTFSKKIHMLQKLWRKIARNIPSEVLSKKFKHPC